MNRRDVVTAVLEHQKPPYVPWSFGFTQEAHAKLQQHYARHDLGEVLGNHLVQFSGADGRFEELEGDRFKDGFGVIWNRSIDKDIGVVEGQQIPEPDMSTYTFPDPADPKVFSGMAEAIKRAGDRFRIFAMGFSLYERAWSLRGMEQLFFDFVESPEFVHELFAAITDFNIAQVQKAVEFDVEGVYFGDDWGQQHGLIFGYERWKEFVYPQLRRMYAAAKDAGKYVFIHSCGDVDELFDDLVGIGLDCFNPFQPEVMDVPALMKQYRGRLTFHGGLSTQKTLPYGSVQDVLNDTEKLLGLGSEGNYIFSPAHAVEGDVPVENMVAFIERVTGQLG